LAVFFYCFADSALQNRVGSTNQTRAVTVSDSHSTEELDMKSGLQVRSAQQEMKLTCQNPGQRYSVRVRETFQSTSGEFLDGNSISDVANQSGPSPEHQEGDDFEGLFVLKFDGWSLRP
jgi:hypothetical protein